MKVEHENTQELGRMIVATVRKFVPDERFQVFVFGSRVEGGSHERSDIDVGIEGHAPLPVGTFLDIQHALRELPTLYTIDVVDFCRTNDKFKRVVREREYLNV